jgi:hypothetical protein
LPLWMILRREMRWVWPAFERRWWPWLQLID